MVSLSPTARAVLWSLLSAFLFTLVFSSGRLLSSEAHPTQIVFVRYFGAMIIISAVALIAYRGFAPLRSPQPGHHVMRATFGVGGEVCSISAPLFLAYEDASAIALTDAVIAMVLAIILLKERASPLHWVAAMTCLAGAMVIARADTGSGEVANASLGIGIAFFGALLSGSEVFMVKLLSRSEKPVAIMLYVNVIAVILLLVPAIWFWQPLHGLDLAWLIAIGPLALLAQYTLLRAFLLGDTVIVAPIGYAGIPIAALIGALMFGQSLSIIHVLGGALVILGGVILARIPERQVAPPPAAPM